MKLYTEEQVRDFFKEHYFLMEKDLDNLTPIELPSDEEIDEWVAKNDYNVSCVDIHTTKWVIEQIKQQGNGK